MREAATQTMVRAVVVSTDGDAFDLVEQLPWIEVAGFLDARSDVEDRAFPNLGSDGAWSALKAREPELKAVSSSIHRSCGGGLHRSMVLRTSSP